MKNLTHWELIEFLKNFKEYENSVTLEETRSTGDLINIDTNDINRCVFLIGSYLNQPTGSSGNVNLYRLLQVYFHDIEKREMINNIIE